MDPIIAYLLVGIGSILVLYFMYLSYQSYQKNPSRWALREVATNFALRVLR